MTTPLHPDRDLADSVAARRARNRRAIGILREMTGWGRQFKTGGPPEGPGDHHAPAPRDHEFREPEPTDPEFFGLEQSNVRRRLFGDRRV